MPTYEYKCPNGHLFEKTFPRISNQRFDKTAEKAEKTEKTEKSDSKPSPKKDSSSDK